MLTAVVSLQGHQYLVRPGEELVVDFFSERPEIKVLALYKDDKIVALGNDASKYRVNFEVVTPSQKGKKITVQTYKAKSRYRRRKGFRPLQTVVKITKIAKDGQK